MTKTKRSIIMSILMLLLCVAAMAGATYALFSDSVGFNQHLQAGTLEITLERTKLEKAELDAKSGFIVKNPDTNGKPDERVIDFSGNQPENVFGIDKTDKIVPGTWYEATFSIQNKSDVAFGYWIEIVCDDNDKINGKDLAKQLKVTVNSDDAFVGEGLVVPSTAGTFIKVLPVGESDTFTVKVEFLDSHIAENKIANNNLAKNQELDFDLVVKAMQVTDDPTQQTPANP